MKKKLMALSMVVICLSTVVSGTIAYFTAEERTHNVITSGGISIQLVEKTRGEDGILVDFPAEGISGVMPGSQVSKIVSVQNTGTATAWVRVRVEQSIQSETGSPLPLQLSGGSDAVSFVIDPACWLEQDGWYYHLLPVDPAESTALLFDSVTFAPQMGNEYQACTANIAISAQAVQTDNNPIPAGGSVADIPGWPLSN